MADFATDFIIAPLREQWAMAYQEELRRAETAKSKAEVRLAVIKMIDSEIENIEKLKLDSLKRYDDIIKTVDDAERKAKLEAWQQNNRRAFESYNQQSIISRFNAGEANAAERSATHARALAGKMTVDDQWEDYQQNRERMKTALKNQVGQQEYLNSYVKEGIEKYIGGIVEVPTKPGETPPVVKDRIVVGRPGSSNTLRVLVNDLYGKESTQQDRDLMGSPMLSIVDETYSQLPDKASRSQLLAVVRDQLKEIGANAEIDQLNRFESMYDGLELDKSEFKEKLGGGGKGGVPGWRGVLFKELETPTKLEAGEEKMYEQLRSTLNAAEAENLLKNQTDMFDKQLGTAKGIKLEQTKQLLDWANGADQNIIDATRASYEKRFGIPRGKSQGGGGSLSETISSLSSDERAKLRQLILGSQPEIGGNVAEQEFVKQLQLPDNRTPYDPNEIDFMNWYRSWSDKLGLDPDPYNPEHYYDYKSAWKNGVEPTYDAQTGEWHWPSEFKLEGHPREFITQPDGSVLDTKTGSTRPPIISGPQPRTVQPQFRTEPKPELQPEDFPIYGPMPGIYQGKRQVGFNETAMMLRAANESKRAAAQNNQGISPPVQVPPTETPPTSSPGFLKMLMGNPPSNEKVPKTETEEERKIRMNNKIMRTSGAPKQIDIKNNHKQEVLIAMENGRELSFQPKKLERLIKNDPISREIARLYQIDTVNGTPLENQIDKIAQSYQEPDKQKRALETLFALRNKNINSKYVKKEDV